MTVDRDRRAATCAHDTDVVEAGGPMHGADLTVFVAVHHSAAKLAVEEAAVGTSLSCGARTAPRSAAALARLRS